MDKMRLLKRVFIFGIILFLFPGQAAAAELLAGRDRSDVVRIGYIDYKGFIEELEDGSYFGYGVEYLNKVAEYTGWQYEYVYGTWEECLDRLRNKEIDFVCTANYSKERDEIFDFSSQEIGVGQGVLYTTPDREDIYYEDFTALEGQKIGFLKGSRNIPAFREYAENKGFTYQELLYATDEEMEKALMGKEIIAIATEHMALHNNVRLIGRFGSDPYYFMTYEGNPELKRLNYALSEIKSYDPGFDAKLYKKYYGGSSAESTPLFTRAEADYIAQSGVITVGSVSNRYPISSWDEKKKEMTGLTVGLMQMISDISGLEFSMRPIAAGKSPAEALKDQDCTLAAGVIENRTYAQDQALDVSNPVMNSELVIVGKRGEGYNPAEEQTLVVADNFEVIADYITEKHPNCNIVYRKNNEECLQAVLDGEADIMMQNIYVMNYWLQNPRYNSLDMAPAFYLEENSCVAALSSEDKRLMSIINKSIDVIPEEDINQLVLDNTTLKPYKLSIGDVLYKYRFPMIVIIILVFVCIVLLLAVIVIRQKNLKQIKEKNAQLLDAIRQADNANLAKSHFLSRMSHEIRTPLNAIVGLTTISRQYTNRPERMEEYLDKIANASKILLNIVNDVLDMSAIESSRLKIAHNVFDFKQLMTSLSNIYYTQCKQKNIRFDLILSGVTEEVLVGDSLRINQVLLNLLSNAVKFTESGGQVKLIVTQKKKTQDKVFMRFDVVDTGCGMDRKTQEKIFRPFEQESAETARKYGGSGLGLSIAKNLVELMHGAVSVDSHIGAGTTFTVDIPFGYVENESEEGAERFRNVRALVLDDDRESAEFTSIVLDHMGISHDCVLSGEEGLKLLQDGHDAGNGYDICFVDWKMPKMDGVEVTRKIRELYDEDTVIIIVSAYDLNEVEEEARLAGANMFVSKPMFQSTVFNVLMNVSGGRRQMVEEAPKEYDFTGRRALVVEDNALNMEIAIDLLDLVNVEVIQALNGKEGVGIFEASEPGSIDVILMDVQMPIMNGYEATMAIRKGSHPEARTIPIYAMTANAFSEDVAASFSAGMDGHISKPIDVDILYDTLEKCFKEKGEAR